MPKKEALTGTVLITGGASGIGYHLAREFACRGHPLVLVGPDVAELNEVTAEIGGSYDVAVQPIAKDLTEEAAAQAIYTELAAKGKTVEILVNNAGLGRRGKFWEITPYDEIAMLRLNIEAVVRLIRLFLPPMLERRSGRILTTASMAGLESGPELAVYHATKAFVLSFSESLAAELNGTGVSLTTLCPGAMDTDFFRKTNTVDAAAFQKANLMAPQEVARGAYAALMGAERVYIPGRTDQSSGASREDFAGLGHGKAE